MSWPTTLPRLALTEGYTEEMPDASYRTEPASGAGKSRPRPDAPPARLRFSQKMTSEQWDIFNVFYYRDLQNGSLAFSEFNPRSGLYQNFMIVGPRTAVHIGGRNYRVSFTLEVQP